MFQNKTRFLLCQVQQRKSVHRPHVLVAYLSAELKTTWLNNEQSLNSDVRKCFDACLMLNFVMFFGNLS